MRTSDGISVLTEDAMFISSDLIPGREIDLTGSGGGTEISGEC